MSKHRGDALYKIEPKQDSCECSKGHMVFDEDRGQYVFAPACGAKLTADELTDCAIELQQLNSVETERRGCVN